MLEPCSSNFSNHENTDMRGQGRCHALMAVMQQEVPTDAYILNFGMPFSCCSVCALKLVCASVRVVENGESLRNC